MTKLVQNDITSLTNEQSALAALNSNYASLETFSDTVLSRDGTSPNQMVADLDMNGNQILNLPAPTSLTDPLRLQELSDFLAHGTISAPSYAEGTFTPSISFLTPGDLAVTYSLRLGNYIKIGRLVTCFIDLNTSAFTYTTASGAIQITGLPFTSVNTAGITFRGGAVLFQGVTKAGFTDMCFSMGPNTNTTSLTMSGSAQTATSVAAADMPSGGAVRFAGMLTYWTAT